MWKNILFQASMMNLGRKRVNLDNYFIIFVQTLLKNMENEHDENNKND